jgi:CheY-like chemotaxis protein
MNSIVRNEVRRLRGRQDGSLLRLDGVSDTPDDRNDMARAVLGVDIERALRRLPENDARSLRLFYLAERSIADLATETGRAPGTIKSWLHSGRKRLAAQMEGYEPMTRTATPEGAVGTVRVAALLHSDLEPGLLRDLTAALTTGGYTPEVLTPDDLGDLSQRAITMIERLESVQLLLLDERIGARSAFEFVINLRSYGETRDIPLCVLHAGAPDAFTGTALFNAGVDRLLDKSDRTQLAQFASPLHTVRKDGWALVSDIGKRVVYLANQEAQRWKQHAVGTEHLLLALVRDDVSPDQPIMAVRILTERFGLTLDRIREETERGMEPGEGREVTWQLTPRGMRVFDLAYDEARLLGSDTVGTEHLLLGLIREGGGRAGRVLARLGVDLVGARAAAHAWRQ